MASVPWRTFASTTTWSDLGDGKTWSDRVILTGGLSGCIHVPEGTAGVWTAVSGLKAFRVTGSGSSLRVYYVWECAYDNRAVLCPSPWSLPTADQINTLATSSSAPTLFDVWGGGGFAYNNYVAGEDTGMYWSLENSSSGWAFELEFWNRSQKLGEEVYSSGLQLRCIK
jgi:hypothetical protein